MKKRILLYGDSNTWGYVGGSDDERYDEDTRWSGLLARSLGGGYVVVEEGQNGRTTVWTDPIENRMSGLDYLWPCLDSQSPLDLVVIMLGTNNLKTYYANSASDIAASAGRLVDVVKSSPFGRGHRAPQVLLVSPVHVRAHPNESMFGKRAEEMSKELAPLYQKAAEERGVYFMDAAPLALAGDADGLHITEAGHRSLAEAFDRKIREIFSSEPTGQDTTDHTAP